MRIFFPIWHGKCTSLLWRLCPFFMKPSKMKTFWKTKMKYGRSWSFFWRQSFIILIMDFIILNYDNVGSVLYNFFFPQKKNCNFIQNYIPHMIHYHLLISAHFLNFSSTKNALQIDNNWFKNQIISNPKNKKQLNYNQQKLYHVS